MKTIANVVILCLLAVAGQGTKKQKADEPKWDTTATTTISSAVYNPPTASTESRITKDGHYVFTLDDPNNEWRCFLTSRVGMYEATTVTFTCIDTSRTLVTDEREGKK